MTDYLDPIAGLVDRKSSITVLSGSDCANFLNRSLTSDISEFTHMERHDSVLCDANGRVIDIASLCRLGDKILMLSQSQGEITRKRLQSGISWSEDVSIIDGNNALTHLTLTGMQWQRALIGIGLDPEDLGDNVWVEFGNMLISLNRDFDVDIIDIALPTNEVLEVTSALIDNGCREMGHDRWDYVRTNIGLVTIEEANGRIPADVSLGSFIDLNKGCYPGQEIHARMDSRGKSAKHIVRFRANRPIEIGKHMVEGIGRILVISSIEYNGKSVGFAIIPHGVSIDGQFEIDGNSTLIEHIISP